MHSRCRGLDRRGGEILGASSMGGCAARVPPPLSVAFWCLDRSRAPGGSLPFSGSQPRGSLERRYRCDLGLILLKTPSKHAQERKSSKIGLLFCDSRPSYAWHLRPPSFWEAMPCTMRSQLSAGAKLASPLPFPVSCGRNRLQRR